MTEKISESQTIPDLLEAVQKTYGVEVPLIDRNSPLPTLWQKSINVTESTPPDPRYTATASISNEFPFNFTKSLQNLNLKVNLRIDVFENEPKIQETRGIKATVFLVPRSNEHPNGVIVKRGLTFVDTAGNSVDDGLSTERIPEESVVPSKSESRLDEVFRSNAL